MLDSFSASELNDEIENSLDAGHFHLAYQPQINLRTKAVDAVEALIRWTHPSMGSLAPADFILRAEALNVIGPIDLFALRQACRDAVHWPESVKIAVNFSARAFSRPALAADIHAAIVNSRLDPKRLEIEITETHQIEDHRQFAQNADEIAALGVALALDDFGTGYTSFQALRFSNFTKIKLDATFVQNSVSENKSHAIAKAVASLGQDLSLTTVAEGLESKEQVDLITSFGFTTGQGYVFARPMPADVLSHFLAADAA
ncbi:EAL domain-containing protein [Acidisoma silvae]|uniref:EAL domain-containing protein n=1 Tax=Acidisoma silvae TaxID=2802396 RepID=A0A963YT49_9PROT|nr:EAL domain-containing protein [Acidisoma silvae]MCB8876577.1 EAL domain-containing protein [Acidisoma silvae]